MQLLLLLLLLVQAVITTAASTQLLVVSLEDETGSTRNVTFDLVRLDLRHQCLEVCLTESCIEQIRAHIRSMVLGSIKYNEYYTVFQKSTPTGGSWLEHHTTPELQARHQETQRLVADDRRLDATVDEADLVGKAIHLFNTKQLDRAEALAYHILFGLPDRKRLAATIQQGALVIAESSIEKAFDDVGLDQSAAFALLSLFVVENDTENEELIGACSTRAADALRRLRMIIATPAIPSRYQEALRRRDDMLRDLQVFTADFAASGAPNLALACLESVISATPFHLAHQGLDDLALQVTLQAALVAVCPELAYISPRLEQRAQLAEAAAAVAASGVVHYQPHQQQQQQQPQRRRRVGFISSHFYHHSVGKILLETISFMVLDPDVALDIVVFFVDRSMSTQDVVTRELERLLGPTGGWVVLPHDVLAVRTSVEERDLDILIFGDLGMEMLTLALSYSRLAPFQAAFWGHPVTSGSPHVDYFFSLDFGEVEHAASSYSEQLVRFDVVNTAHIVSDFPSHIDRPWTSLNSLLGREGAVVCMVLGRLFKLHPSFTATVADILVASHRAGVDTIVAFIAEEVSAWNEEILKRIEAALPQNDAKLALLARVRFIPYESSYFRLLEHPATRVVLDTFPYGGCLTTHDALTEGVPVVTLPQRPLSGRFTAAMYAQAGGGQLTELVAQNQDEYTSIVMRLLTDEIFFQTQANAVRTAFDTTLHRNHLAAKEWSSFIKRLEIHT